MRKYFIIFKQNIIKHFEYRVNNFIYLLVGLLPAIINYFIWLAVYGQREEMNGFRKSDLFTYYLVMTVLFYFIGGTINRTVSKVIRTGELNQLLTKPIHPIKNFIALEQGWKVSSLTFVIPVFVALIFLLNLSIPVSSIDQLIYLIISIILGAVIFSLWDMIIGMLAFFLQETNAIDRLSRIVGSFLNGQSIPLALMPAWVVSINDWIFYRYTFAFPADILFRFDTLQLGILFFRQFLWVFLMYLFLTFIFKAGMKRYEAYGA